MKVNQIVGEQKKSLRATKYTTKTKDAEPVGKLSEVDTMATAVKQNPDGSTVYKDASGAEKTAAAGEIKTDPATGKPTLAVAGINPGEQINIVDKVDENPYDTGPVGGDPTDNYIDQISSDERLDDGMRDKPYYVDMSSGSPMIKSGNGLTPVQPSKMWTQLTPEVIAKARGQGFRQINISVNGQILRGLEGGGKVIVSPADFSTMSRPKPVQTPYPDRSKVQEADDILLDKMLTIARLR
jgi:hypothetical protein